jgi:hypothetical protein
MHLHHVHLKTGSVQSKFSGTVETEISGTVETRIVVQLTPKYSARDNKLPY